MGSGIPPGGMDPKEPKTLTEKNTCTPRIIAALFTNAKIWNQPNCPLADE